MTETRVHGVSVVHWNPRRNVVSLPVTPIRWGPRINNFGDLLGVDVVRSLSGRAIADGGARVRRGTRLLAVGSILHLAKTGDVVWGSGINGKVSDYRYRARRLDIRAVRGPRTRARLQEWGFDVPESYGDPALLLPSILGIDGRAETTAEYVVIPNLNDEGRWSGLTGVMSPRQPLSRLIERIRSVEFVVASSLHAIVLADAFGVPSILVASENEPRFKYDDYFNGTERDAYRVAATVPQGIEEARRMIAAGSEEVVDLTGINRALYESFPADIWGSAELTMTGVGRK